MKKEYCVKFNDSWCNKFKSIQKSRKGDSFALCTVCGSDFSVAHGGKNEDMAKHKGYVNVAHRFWCELSDCKLRPKSSESKTIFF